MDEIEFHDMIVNAEDLLADDLFAVGGNDYQIIRVQPNSFGETVIDAFDFNKSHRPRVLVKLIFDRAIQFRIQRPSPVTE